jgi:PAS domain S-box-containing protein
MTFQINFIIVSIVLTAVVTFSLLVFAWRRRTEAWATPFILLALTVAEWSIIYAFELASPDLASKILWAKVEYIGIIGTPVAWFLFAMLYGGRETWLTRRNLILLGIIPVLTFVFVLTNEQHHFIWQTTTLSQSASFRTMDVTYGFWFWIHSGFSYLIILIGIVLLFLSIRRYPAAYRWQLVVLSIGPIAPLLGSIVYVADISPFDLAPTGFAIGAIIFAWGIQRQQLFKLIPIARRLAVDSMSDAMFVLDMQNRILDVNPTAVFLTNYPTADDIIGQNIQAILFDHPELIETLQTTTETQSEISLGVQGQEHWYDVRISPLQDGRQELRGHLLVLRDITERKQIEQELVHTRDQALQASQFKSELLAKVSHELRTPLAVILGSAEMLQVGVYDLLADKQKEPVNRIIKNTRFLVRHVNELLDLATIDAGKLTLEPTSFSPETLAARVQDKMEMQAKEKGLTFLIDIAHNMPDTLIGDAYRIEQILLNLVGNAIKFTDVGHVAMNFSGSDNGHWIMEVSDTGCGIPDEAHNYIFESFRQVDGSLTKMGAGLGLAIVKQLTGLMQGTIELESALNRGTTIRVSLPRNQVVS